MPDFSGIFSADVTRGERYGWTPWINVSSTNVAAGRWFDGARSLEADADRMQIQFLNGSIYEYTGVGRRMWEDFLTAGSKGRWVNDVLKRGGYPYSRV